MVFNLHALGRAARSALRLLAGPDRASSFRGATVRSKGLSTRAVRAATTPRGMTGAELTSPRALTYPGDYAIGPEPLHLRYSPSPDGTPDPGEIVWTWVPYQEDFSRGKDRPVLIIGSRGGYLLALMLTSKDHDGGRAARAEYVDVGIGAWDKQGRPSEVKVDRVLQIREGDVRREGAVLDKAGFQAVAAALAERNGWTAQRP